ncbi:hypothetical protein F511_20168 [Dorcoceras hygrometricum]|uniref:Uncharacterized protein n=1 Tax=Dorcoceras hygrometricum TaxID=472368 RepID=A0A2Z7D0S5_9LAMI|nr:hypothetical protein F511_20168 [Dorcoceras hygrometricum]
MIALDFLGTTHQSASHNVAFNRVINQSVNQAQDNHIIKSHNINYSHVPAQAAKSAQFVHSTVEIYLNRFSQRHGTNNRSKSASSRYQIHDRDSLELKSVPAADLNYPDVATVERRCFIISDWFFNPTAGHSAGTILTTQQLIALQLRSETKMHHSFATVPLTRVDV